jgi:hypothetical protein
MKKEHANKSGNQTKVQLRREYRLDYSKAKPNRFASHADDSSLVVTIDPDVSKVFPTADAVNKALRAFINGMPSATVINGK